jgi:hypothetical protein
MNSTEQKRYNGKMGNKPYDKDSEEIFNSFTELCHYADEFHLVVELEKPFEEFDQLFLKIIDSDGEETYRVTIEDIVDLNDEAADLLNEISKTKH